MSQWSLLRYLSRCTSGFANNGMVPRQDDLFRLVGTSKQFFHSLRAPGCFSPIQCQMIRQICRSTIWILSSPSRSCAVSSLVRQKCLRILCEERLGKAELPLEGLLPHFRHHQIPKNRQNYDRKAALDGDRRQEQTRQQTSRELVTWNNVFFGQRKIVWIVLWSRVWSDCAGAISKEPCKPASGETDMVNVHAVLAEVSDEYVGRTAACKKRVPRTHCESYTLFAAGIGPTTLRFYS